MIVDDLDPFGTFVSPSEAEPIQVVNADRVMPLSISAEGFQTIAWRYSKRSQRHTRV